MIKFHTHKAKRNIGKGLGRYGQADQNIRYEVASKLNITTTLEYKQRTT